MITKQLFDASLLEEEFGILIDAMRKRKKGKALLIQLLPQGHPVYSGRGTNQVNHMRGYILASFEKLGLPEKAMVFALEELENSLDPYLVAAAAKAIRGLKYTYDSLDTYLQKAIYNIGRHDDAISFEIYKPEWPLSNYTTALHEILHTYGWLKGQAKQRISFLEDFAEGNIIPVSTEIKLHIKATIAVIKQGTKKPLFSCCELREQSLNWRTAINLPNVEKLLLEDQDKNKLAFKQFFCDVPVVIAFFYTRCDNPNKCSLTISKLAQLQQILKAMQLHKVKIAAITYDSGYDNPDRLRAYLEIRKLETGTNTKAFRVLDNGFVLLNKYLKLDVNYLSSIVNQHRIELVILDKQARVVKKFSGLQWQLEEVADFLKKHLSKKRSGTEAGKSFYTLFSNIPPILIALLPKCPVCFAVYLSAFGVSGIGYLSAPLYRTLLIILLLINLIILYYSGKLNKFYIPFLLAISGSVILVSMNFLKWSGPLQFLGVLCIIIASVLNAVTSFTMKRYVLFSLKRIKQLTFGRRY